MVDYKLNDEKIYAIAKQFNTKPETVQSMNALYKDISDGIKYQYLAHVIRTVEEKVGKHIGEDRFQIKCIAMPAGSNVNFGCAQYFGNDLYIIYYPEIDEKQIRIIIAHELGHLVVETLIKDENPNEGVSEPLSSIFGILTILDKNDFYQCRSSKYQHPSWEQILQDFELLSNRAKNINNIS